MLPEGSQPRESTEAGAVPRDTWGRGVDSYVEMMYQRLHQIRDLLSEQGSIWVHSDWRIGYVVRSVLDEVFGQENFRNEIAWVYKNAGFKAKAHKFHQIHDVLFWYAKTD